MATSPAPRTPKKRPDPRPLRLALAGGGVAVLSALLAAIAAPMGDTALTDGANAQEIAAADQPIRYIQLAPGQTAPPGATVIDGAAPAPTTIVTRVPAPTPRPIRIRTTQSGKVIP